MGEGLGVRASGEESNQTLAGSNPGAKPDLPKSD